MGRALRKQSTSAAFDVVGRYNQDEINGFDPSLIERLLAAVNPAQNSKIIELMGGDGNFTSRILKFCSERDITPASVSMLEYSKVQSEFARMELEEDGAEVIWGDVLTMSAIDTGVVVTPGVYDRAIIKSSNHEIPQSKQETLYRNVFEILRPGGSFINLGMLFEDPRERDELAAIGRAKDSLAGMSDAVKNRFWLTQKDLYGFLKEVGFVDIHSAEKFDYSIASNVVSRHYFDDGARDHFDLEFQASQARARHMRKNGRIKFERDYTVMRCPGEITVARKPSIAERNANIFNEYPYDFVRHIEAHRSLLNEVERVIPEGASVLDIGCGLGLLAERLTANVSSYLGIDLSEEFTKIASARIPSPHFTFRHADVNESALSPSAYDVVAIVNALYLEGIDPIRVLTKTYDALKKGGKIVLTGPITPQSFIAAAPKMQAQLERDGMLKGNEEIFAGIKGANSHLLSSRAHYWSAEGMVELLRQIGFTPVSHSSHHFYGNAYLVVAEK